ncbi:MAG: DNA photolyase [Deltaproteobacteria bacterium]|jgi:spore photoproduct lyase|nr:DNA photolyase [Deltaproteobacteria bacterium]
MIPQPNKLWVEEEFAALMDGTNGQIISPITPKDYPSFGAGETVITRRKGSFIKACPATPRYNCCGLNIFHFGQGCDLGCSYCVLTSYLGSRALIYFGNASDEGLSELQTALDNDLEGFKDPNRPYGPSRRFCTGEFTDSLLLDPWTNLSSKLIALFARYNTFQLELKTKTTNVDHLLDLNHNGRTIISFSVNAPWVCQIYENGVPRLTERLKAAAKAASAGYPVGFHFDPLIYFPGWERGYEKASALIAQNIRPESIALVSLGCFRFPPNLKQAVLKLRPTNLFDAEFIRGEDGKMRYPRTLRRRMYKRLLESLKPILGPKTKVYLCMESGRLWREVFGYDPGTKGLTEMFRVERA